MSTSSATNHASAARSSAQSAVNFSYGGNTGLAVRNLADAVEHLSRAVEELATSVRRIERAGSR